jgi:hypothetical protein
MTRDATPSALSVVFDLPTAGLPQPLSGGGWGFDLREVRATKYSRYAPPRLRCVQAAS